MNSGFEYSIRSKRALKSCFVYGCFSTAAANNKTIGFHKFPRRDKRIKRNIVIKHKKNGDKCIYDRRQLWIQALNIGRRAACAIDGLEIYACSLHFSRDDYYYNQDVTGRRYLKELAIPRRNLPARCSSPLTTKFNVRHLNRLRYRGYFNIHNPDGRKLTAPRRFLGANKAKDLPHKSQSLTKTVWVVRKPKEETHPAAYSTIDDQHHDNQEPDSNQIVKQTEDELQELNIDRAEFEQFEEAQAAVDYDNPTTSGGYDVVEESEYYENNAQNLIYEENGYEEGDQEYFYYETDEDNGQQNVLYNKICRTCGALNCPGHRKRTTKENVFVCLICSDIFSSQRRLDKHTTTYHGEGLTPEEIAQEEKASLTCGFCSRVLSTKSTLREHIMIHTGEKPHECKLCGKLFRHKANLVVHVNGHAELGGYKCKKCNKAFTKKSEFDKHLQIHVDPSGTPLVCRICDAVFKSQRTLHNHSLLHDTKGFVNRKKRKETPGDPKFTCPTCKRVLSTKATLKEHMMIHSGERPHECPFCGRMIRHKANFVVHIQTHGQGKSYECDMCDQAFMRKSDLQRHKQASHAMAKLIRCAICAEVFKSPLKFNRHMEMHESVVYMNETEELTGYHPHLLEGFLETDDGVLDL